MRPDLMPNATTYTRFQLSGLELGLILGAVAIAILWYWIPKFADGFVAEAAAAEANQRMAGRAVGYAGVKVSQYRYDHCVTPAWRHGHAEGVAAKDAGKPLDYLNEVPPALIAASLEESHGG